MSEKQSPPMDIQTLIHQIRGKSVMLDRDLTLLYQVETKRLNEIVKRNFKRFPADFMFQLSREEIGNLRSQFATSSYGGWRYLPHAFTEQGVAMLSSVLNSDIAIEVNINTMRTFVQMRRLTLSMVDIRCKIDAMENRYNSQFKMVFDALRKLLAPEPMNKRTIGFIKDQH